MIHTIYLDDSTPKGRELLQNLLKESDVVYLKKPLQMEDKSGYLSSGEFRTTVKAGLIERLKKDGRL